MADATEIGEKVREIIAEQALIEPSDVKGTDTLEDLGIDSLGLVECVFGIEEAFDINVPFNANDPTDSQFDISNVDSMIGAVVTLIKASEEA